MGVPLQAAQRKSYALIHLFAHRGPGHTGLDTPIFPAAARLGMTQRLRDSDLKQKKIFMRWMVRCNFATLKNKHLHFQSEQGVPLTDFLFPAVVDGSISEALSCQWVDAGGRLKSKHVRKGAFLTS